MTHRVRDPNRAGTLAVFGAAAVLRDIYWADTASRGLESTSAAAIDAFEAEFGEAATGAVLLRAFVIDVIECNQARFFEDPPGGPSAARSRAIELLKKHPFAKSKEGAELLEALAATPPKPEDSDEKVATERPEQTFKARAQQLLVSIDDIVAPLVEVVPPESALAEPGQPKALIPLAELLRDIDVRAVSETRGPLAALEQVFAAFCRNAPRGEWAAEGAFAAAYGNDATACALLYSFLADVRVHGFQGFVEQGFGDGSDHRRLIELVQASAIPHSAAGRELLAIMKDVAVLDELDGRLAAIDEALEAELNEFAARHFGLPLPPPRPPTEGWYRAQMLIQRERERHPATTIRIPVHVIEAIDVAQRLRAELELTLDRAPTFEELVVAGANERVARMILDSD